MNPILEFERWIADGMGKVERLEYKESREFIDSVGKFCNVFSLALLFDDVGIYSLKYVDEFEKSINVATLAVKPSEQGKGIGKRMLKILCGFADRYGYYLSATAQLLKLTGEGFTRESFGKPFGEPINDLKRDYTWKRFLVDTFDFAPAGDNNIFRGPKKRQ
jgi:GNAT superfamily N-acetyltransferase